MVKYIPTPKNALCASARGTVYRPELFTTPTKFPDSLYMYMCKRA